jgi:transposase
VKSASNAPHIAPTGFPPNDLTAGVDWARDDHALAGAAPSTRQSGKLRAVGFRWSCDRQLRDAVTDLAADSRLADPWAADLHNRAITRGHDHPHAVRILARAWLLVMWHCWHDGVAHDPNHHRALQQLLATANAA